MSIIGILGKLLIALACIQAVILLIVLVINKNKKEESKTKKSFKELIYSKGYSVYSFAKACDVRVQTIRDITTGRRVLGGTRLSNNYKRAQVLEIPLEELVIKY